MHLSIISFIQDIFSSSIQTNTGCRVQSQPTKIKYQKNTSLLYHQQTHNAWRLKSIKNQEMILSLPTQHRDQRSVSYGYRWIVAETVFFFNKRTLSEHVTARKFYKILELCNMFNRMALLTDKADWIVFSFVDVAQVVKS